MTYNDYRKKINYIKRYNTKDQRGLYHKLDSVKYQQLSEYDRTAYRRLVLIRQIANDSGIEIKKLTKQDTFFAVTSDGLTKKFDSLDDLENFIYKFNLVNQYLFEE